MAGKRRALIIATAQYQDPKLRRLRAPAADAEQLAAVLADPNIGDFDVGIAPDEDEPTLTRRIARFFTQSARDDVLLMHVSCHGVKDSGGALYLAAADTEMELLDATAISAAWLERQMSRSPSRRKLLLLDCCFSGKFPFGATARAGDDVDVQGHLQGRGRAVITASSAMEYAYEGDELSGEGQPSYFTAAIVEALSTGEADRDQDHWISVDELYDYVFERVKDLSPHQTPSKQIALEGPLYIARSSYRAPVKPVALDRHLLDLLVHPYTGARLGGVDDLTKLLDATDPGVVLAARQALERMLDDDSREVAARARAALERPGEPRTPEQAGEAMSGPDERAARRDVAEAGEPDQPGAEDERGRLELLLTQTADDVAEQHGGMTKQLTSRVHTSLEIHPWLVTAPVQRFGVMTVKRWVVVLSESTLTPEVRLVPASWDEDHSALDGSWLTQPQPPATTTEPAPEANEDPAIVERDHVAPTSRSVAAADPSQEAERRLENAARVFARQHPGAEAERQADGTWLVTAPRRRLRSARRWLFSTNAHGYPSREELGQ